jgi:hypothetical protein
MDGDGHDVGDAGENQRPTMAMARSDNTRASQHYVHRLGLARLLPRLASISVMSSAWIGAVAGRGEGGVSGERVWWWRYSSDEIRACVRACVRACGGGEAAMRVMMYYDSGREGNQLSM